QKRSKLLTGLTTGVALLLLISLLATTITAIGRQPLLLVGDREAPVAAALIFDTSPRMAYERDNQTRLAEAQEAAEQLIRQLPKSSDIAVLDSQLVGSVFSVDFAAARKAVRRLKTVGAPRSMGEVVQEGLKLLRTAELERREVYIFTDLTQAAWNGSSQSIELQAGDEGVSVYVIDVGVDEATNFSLGELRMSSEVAASNGGVDVQVRVHCEGAPGTRQVEIHIEEPDAALPIIRDGKIVTPAERTVDRQAIELDPGGEAALTFRLDKLPLGVHQGRVRFLAEDALSVDDTRYFTVRVEEAWPLLVVAADNVWSVFFTEAIAPTAHRESGKARFDITQVAQTEFDGQSLGDFRAVCFLDPKPLTPTQWREVRDFAEAGGAVGFFLGRNASPEAFQHPDALQVLPGALSRQWRAADGDLFIEPRRFNHPLTAIFRDRQTSTPWPLFPVYRHWVFDPLLADASTIVPFSNGRPAIIERRLGRGFTLTMTTPLSEPSAGVNRPTPWNELASGQDNWPPFLLANTIAQRLAASGDIKLNYLAGEPATLPNHSLRDPAKYQLFAPGADPQELAARESQVSVVFTETPGAYRLKGFRGGPIVRGFAVNYRADTADLARLDVKQLDGVFGEDRWSLVEQMTEIERAQGAQRVGREFYPLLMVVLVMLLGMEHLLANRFYNSPPAARSVPDAATAGV
ncbi:MAG: hypothetical protein QF805_16190, partial [Pirellulaceae bacterium]|nr:hypothetical protein [Pirellulaceae bacterium]